jgi:RNA recognition motif-containing protein
MINPATIASSYQHNSGPGDDSRRPSEFKSFDPSKPTNLFVGNLQPWMEESYLHQVFSRFGELKHVKIVRDRNSQQPQGYGFIDFGDHEIAKQVLTTWDDICKASDTQQTTANLKLNWGVRGGGYNIRNLEDRIPKPKSPEEKSEEFSGEVSVSFYNLLAPNFWICLIFNF